MKPENDKLKHIEVLPYDPNWIKIFETEAALLKQTLGTHCLAIHHVGSTSVPGLAAKPKVDIILELHHPENYTNALESIGYEFRGEFNIPFQFGFSKRAPYKINLHVFEPNHPEIELNLLFRDYLRKHPQAVSEYAALKYHLLKDGNLLEKKTAYFTDYTLGKNAFIHDILNKAGFNRLRMLHASHHAEWDAIKQFRQTSSVTQSPKSQACKIQSFDTLSSKTAPSKTPPPNPLTPDTPQTSEISETNSVHLVLYRGINIIGYCNIQLQSKHEACITLLVFGPKLEQQNIDTNNTALKKHFLDLCILWLKKQGYQSIAQAN